MRKPINTKKELFEYILSDQSCLSWSSLSKKEKLIKFITCDTQYQILRYLKYMRKDEYLENIGHNKIDHVRWIINRRKMNRLGQRLQIELFSSCFGKNLSIYHGGIIVHPSAEFGDGCKLHGHNCIGNNGISGDVPIGGNKIDLGVGACIFGNIVLGNNITIGANAVVNKSVLSNDLTLVGIPAKIVEDKK